MDETTKPLSKRVEAVVRHVMRNLHPDGPESVPEVEGLPEFMTPAEVDEVNAEVVRRLYAGIDKMRDRIAARLPHLTEDQLAVLDRELHDSIAPAGKRPEAASGGASRVARARLKGRPVSIPATRRRCGTGATRGRARLKQGATSRGCSLRKCRALPLRRRRCVRVACRQDSVLRRWPIRRGMQNQSASRVCRARGFGGFQGVVSSPFPLICHFSLPFSPR